eukprot:GEMP01017357.1.p1 GENE.GEMP01017357.1~~GEMP01017357.1.p1  ORF type:complete len:327 (+),score=73.69 GEMP01017357.1:599-1579(+)
MHQNTLQFRATVSFSFDSIPYHFSGGWQTSKKKSQRDAAERVLYYCKRRHIGRSTDGYPDKLQEIERTDSMTSDLQTLVDSLNGGRMTTTYDERGDHEDPYRATVSFSVDGIPHNFRGSWASSQELAMADLTERIMWFFCGPTEEGDSYAAAKLSSPSSASSIPPAVSSPTVDPFPDGASPLSSTCKSQDSLPGRGAAVESAREARDKTILMQVQNQLQKVLAKEIPPTQRVWAWHYEQSEVDQQMFRARVEVSSMARTFVGDWARGKKLAQRSACLKVQQHLELLPDAERDDEKDDDGTVDDSAECMRASGPPGLFHPSLIQDDE